MRTFGKGIGQTSFKTYAGGLAKITDLEFFTPNGNSYHGKGIYPKYECEGAVNDTCAAKIANKLYGVKIPQSSEGLAKRSMDAKEEKKEFEGGAIEWADEKTYLKFFEKSKF
jgi:C-terminal processing protease CtpA/Prc